MNDFIVWLTSFGMLLVIARMFALGFAIMYSVVCFRLTLQYLIKVYQNESCIVGAMAVIKPAIFWMLYFLFTQMHIYYGTSLL